MTLRAAAFLFDLGTGTVSILTAQTVSIRPELGAQLTYWRLEPGGYNRVGPTVHLGVFLPRGTPIALCVAGSYAPRGDLTPGILAIGGQAAVPLFGARPAGSRRVGLELVMGFGGLHFDGSTGVELGNPCGPDGCFEEGVFFHDGWAQVLEVGFGLEIPVGPKLFAHPGGAPQVELERTRLVESSTVTHLAYRIVSGGPQSRTRSWSGGRRFGMGSR